MIPAAGHVSSSLSRFCQLDRFGANQSWSHGATLIGCLSLFGYVFLKLAFPHVSDAFLGVLAITFFMSLYRAPLTARRDPTLLYVVAAITLGLVSYFHSRWAIPQYAEPHPFLDILLNYFIFYIVAWWMGGRTRNVLIFLSLALAGLGFALIVRGSAMDIRNIMDGIRVGFGLRDPQHAAMFFAVAIIGWVVFARRVLGNTGAPHAMSRKILWFLVLVLLIGGSVVTQTRAAWLGLAFAGVVAMIGFAVSSRSREIVRQVLPFVAVGSLVAAVIVGGLAGSILSKRLGEEHQVISQLATGKASEVPESNVGIRVKVWTAALSWVKERPLLGWGYEGRSHVVRDSPVLSQRIRDAIGHLHNSYIEVLLIYGVTGFALLALLIGWVGKCAWTEWRRGNMPTDVFYFGMCFFAYWLVVNVFESYIIWSAGTYLVTIVGGVIYTYRAGRLQTPADAQ